jgi:Integrase core domain
LPQNGADPAVEVCLRKHPTGGSDDERVQQASRHDLARALAPRYAHASRHEKGQLLDEFCALTGYTRKHALVLLSHPPAEERVWNRRGRPPSYGPAEVALLRVCWAATDGICAKRLAPFLPELLRRLRRWHALEHVSAETIERVAHLSPATIDRALASSRDGLPKRGLSTTRPGTLLKHQVAIKTFADWTETVPGFVEVDLVAHCGWTGAGPFLYTLTLVDVATGWVSCAGLRDKRAQTVLAAVRRLQAGLPFTLLGLDSDSGSEFLNTALLDYCAEQHITFTRGRPYRKNDGCFVEQKNWAVVRRLVGYQRLEAPALAALERVHELARGYVNFLHPVRRLTEKVRHGARITRRYDTAQTPYRRLLASGTLTKRAAGELAARSAALDPLRLKLELEAAQRTLAQRAVRPAVVHPLRSESL